MENGELCGGEMVSCCFIVTRRGINTIMMTLSCDSYLWRKGEEWIELSEIFGSFADGGVVNVRLFDRLGLYCKVDTAGASQGELSKSGRLDDHVEILYVRH